MAATGLQIVKRALRLIEAIDAGETPDSDEQSDGLSALNTMLDDWNARGLRVFSTEELSLSWGAGDNEKTLGGATADFTDDRPASVLKAWQVFDGNDYQVALIEYDRWVRIFDKSISSDLLEYLYINNDFPARKLHVYPTPSQTITLKLLVYGALQSFPTATTEIAMPPGYQRAVEYNLALELAPEFGVQPSAIVVRTAADTLRNIATENRRIPSLVQESSMITRRGNRYNIQGDVYR